MSTLSQEGAEWETRKISIFGAAKSFISQLSIGQDLTRVSLPSVFLYPYSALELAGARFLTYCNLLFEVNREEDPLRRFLKVIRWLLACTQKEKFEKKPYNPILGEVHICWADSEKYGKTRFFAEQVSHHPPVASYTVENIQENISTLTNTTFSIKFHGNSVSIKTDGPLKVDIFQFQEQYIFSKSLPDVCVRNLILGTKRIAWDGEINIYCPKSGLEANIVYKEEGWSSVNVAHGSISRRGNSVPLYTFSGACSGVFTLCKYKTNETELLLDSAKVEKSKVRYQPREDWSELCSLRVWEEVNQAIVDNNMEKADSAKRIIEENQRKRLEAGRSLEPRFFTFNSTTRIWEPSRDPERVLITSTQNIPPALTDSDYSGNSMTVPALDPPQVALVSIDELSIDKPPAASFDRSNAKPHKKKTNTYLP